MTGFSLAPTIKRRTEIHQNGRDLRFRAFSIAKEGGTFHVTVLSGAVPPEFSLATFLDKRGIHGLFHQASNVTHEHGLSSQAVMKKRQNWRKRCSGEGFSTITLQEDPH